MGSVMFSEAVSVGTRLKDWKTKPMRSRRSRVSCLSLRVERSVSPTKVEPSLTESSPAMQCMRVDFPDPEGPMMAVNSPVRNSTETESSAVTRVSPLP